MKYNGLEINSRNLRSMKLSPIAICNNQPTFEWLSKLNFNDNAKINSKATERFEKHWGEADFRMILDGKTFVWVRKYKGEIFIVFTSKKGTDYTLLTDQSLDDFSKDQEKPEIIIGFLKQVLKQKEQ